MYTSTRVFLTAALLVGCFLMLHVTAEAQIRSIKGTVTDASTGKPIAGAQMTFQRVDIPQTLNTKTNAKGAYAYLLGQQAATFRIIIHAQGYQHVVMENVRPEMGDETIRDFKLIPGEDRKSTYEMTEQEKAEFEKKAGPAQKKMNISDAATKDFASAMKFVSEGKYAEGIDEFKKVIEKYPKEPALHAAIANSYMKIGKNEEALASYQEAIQLDPQNASYFANMGLALNGLGKTAESQESFKKAAALNPGAAAENFYRLGITLVNSGQTDQATEAFKKSLEADANYAESYYQLGICLSAKPDTMKAAIEALKKYIGIGKKPDQVDVAKQLITALGGK
jgi:Tfp pilus assembly protein PilF